LPIQTGKKKGGKTSQIPQATLGITKEGEGEKPKEKSERWKILSLVAYEKRRVQS
jgi:hypothetical protein